MRRAPRFRSGRGGLRPSASGTLRPNDILGPIVRAGFSSRNKLVHPDEEYLARPRRLDRGRHSRTRYWLPEFLPCRLFSTRCEIAVALIGGLGGDRWKIVCQIACRIRAESCHSAPHILFRKRIVSGVLAETPKLALDILRPLSSQSWRDHI